MGKSAGQIGDEVIRHLAELAGAESDIRLEVQVRVPDGIEDDVVRTMSENCNVLKFDHCGFEED